MADSRRIELAPGEVLEVVVQGATVTVAAGSLMPGEEPTVVTVLSPNGAAFMECADNLYNGFGPDMDHEVTVAIVPPPSEGDDA